MLIVLLLMCDLENIRMVVGMVSGEQHRATLGLKDKGYCMFWNYIVLIFL
jgi:hypothetical protein